MLVYRHNPLYIPKAKNEDSLITIATEKVEKSKILVLQEIGSHI